MMKAEFGLGDLALTFKVTADMNNLNLNQLELMCKYGGVTSVYSGKTTTKNQQHYFMGCKRITSELLSFHWCYFIIEMD